MKKAIVYSPIIDFLLLTGIITKAEHEDPYAEFVFQGQNPWHAGIKDFNYHGIPSETTIFKTDSITVDYEGHEILKKFLAKHKFSFNVPMPKRESNPRIMNVTAAAIMELMVQWPEIHKAKKETYSISAKDSTTGKELDIQGYHLKKVLIGLKNDKEVLCGIDLGDNFSIILSDLTAFTDLPRDFEATFAQTPFDLYKMLYDFPRLHMERGYLTAPTVSVSASIPGHLTGIKYKAEHPNGKNPDAPDKWIQEINIIGSHQEAELKLSEHGVEARARGYAAARMVFGCAASHERVYSLTIKHGLVVGIYYGKVPIFVAYVPQSEFKQTS